MVEYQEAFAGYVKSEGEPLKIGDTVTLHTGEHALLKEPKTAWIDGYFIRVWVVEVNPCCFIPITEMFLHEEDAPVVQVPGNNTLN